MTSSFSGQKEETTRSSELLVHFYGHTRPQNAGKRISIATAMIKSNFKMATNSCYVRGRTAMKDAVR